LARHGVLGMMRSLRLWLSPSFVSAVALALATGACRRPTSVSDAGLPPTSAAPSVSAALSNASLPDAGDATVPPAPRVFSPEELSAWCRDATRPRARGSSGQRATSFPLPSSKICRERFTYRVKAFVPKKPGDYGLGDFVVAIVHLADDGQTEEVHEFRVFVADGWDSQTLTDFEIGDVDGDGTAEVFYAIDIHGEGTFDSKPVLLTLQNGKLEPAKLPGGYKAAGFVDADGDGLWDVLTNGPYEGISHDTGIGGDVPYFSSGMFLMHSLGGFKFSLDDAWSKKTIKKTCPQKILERTEGHETPGPEPKDAADPDWRNPKQIVCARVFGDDRATVRSALQAQCGRFESRPFNLPEGCFESLRQIADREPPVHLPPPPRQAPDASPSASSHPG
jgi:hypothetical protein